MPVQNSDLRTAGSSLPHILVRVTVEGRQRATKISLVDGSSVEEYPVPKSSDPTDLTLPRQVASFVTSFLVPSVGELVIPKRFLSDLMRWALSQSGPNVVYVESPSIDGWDWEVFRSQCSLERTLFVNLVADGSKPGSITKNRLAGSFRPALIHWNSSIRATASEESVDYAIERDAFFRLANTILEGNLSNVVEGHVLTSTDAREHMDALELSGVSLLHVSGARGNRNGLLFAPVDLVATGESEEPELETFDLGALAQLEGPALVVLNGPNTAAAARRFAGLGVAAVGWSGYPSSAQTAEFSSLLYGLLPTAETLLGALLDTRLSITQLSGDAASSSSSNKLWRFALSSRRDPTLQIFLPTIGYPTIVPRPVPKSPAVELANRERAGEAAESGVATADSAVLEIELDLVKTISPALLINGEPIVTRLVAKSSRGPARAELLLECDTGAGKSVWRESVALTGHETYLLRDGSPFHFPALFDLFEKSINRRQVVVTASLVVAGATVASRTLASTWIGPNEWTDSADTWRFMPAYVQPNSPGMLELIGNAQATLRIISGTEAVFEGYSQKQANVNAQVRALFQTLRDPPYEIKYIGPPGGEVGFALTGGLGGQLVRLADEVLGRRRGTCHDLALTLAAALEHVRLSPIVVLLGGHTLVGYWSSPDQQLEYWGEVTQAKSRKPDYGQDYWTIVDPREFAALVSERKILLLEATTVTDRDASLDQARRMGKKRLLDAVKSRSSTFDVAVDIRAGRRWIQPLN